ncbi:DEAD/DEAH box helicase [Thalassorhabdus alkalitolerans]|uniref:DEAD/DEAH box helicase n=1 Tax=Thalassorhabdus alkalitolerans TaxID=2282697 RepID=A0ABW0YPG8_9BACI
MYIDIHFPSDWEQEWNNKMQENKGWSSWEQFQLAFKSEQHTIVSSFSGLVSPPHLPHLQFHSYQVETAQRVIEEMNGKAILADEVGLGKTIEAGLILKEYMIRGLVKKALILAPASLVNQWARELNEKFFIPAVPQKKTYVWEQCDVVVASIDTAKRAPHREIVLNQDYDIVIIDEAHKLKNAKTKNYQFAKELKKRFCLLLTATPVQNKIDEVFHLVSLLKPGHLGNEESFKGMMKQAEQEDLAHIQALIKMVMVRNKRKETGLNWTKRKISSISIEFNKEERELYEAISLLKKRKDNTMHGFLTTTLQREACSSREAVFMTLQGLAKREGELSPGLENVKSKIENITQNSKAEKALEIIKEHDDKVVIFTEYRATQLYLQWFLGQHGIKSVPFRGGFKRGKKDWMQQLFKQNAQVLIATEAGGEGINLQFCNKIINYDLPWNPMRIEQRIGRLHRLGQERDVLIYNFAVNNTIEEHILSLLYNKINLFENVIGELDEILERLSLSSVEEYVEDAVQNSESEGEVQLKLRHLSEMIEMEKNEEKGDDLFAAT